MSLLPMVTQSEIESGAHPLTVQRIAVAIRDTFGLTHTEAESIKIDGYGRTSNVYLGHRPLLSIDDHLTTVMLSQGQMLVMFRCGFPFSPDGRQIAVMSTDLIWD